MTLIGTLLTALVVAREWERGTMEALLATPVSAVEFLLGKLIPYFVLGMVAMVLSVSAAVWSVRRAVPRLDRGHSSRSRPRTWRRCCRWAC